MSQQQSFNQGGGGGGGDVTSLTPDTGGAVTATGGTIPVLGQTAGSAQAMETYKDLDTNSLMIADQTFWSPYVVDPSVIEGLKGTYTTIQAALDAAAADGMAFNAPRQIVIRPGTYNENLNIPGGAFLVGYNGPSHNGSILLVTVIGIHVIGNLGVFYAKDIMFQTTATPTALFTGASTAGILYFENCNLTRVGSGGLININSNLSLDCFNCNFVPDPTDEEFVFGTVQNATFRDCNFLGCDFTATGGTLRFYNCRGIGDIDLNGSNIIASESSFTASDNNINATGSANNSLAYCSFASNNSEAYAVSDVGGSGWTIQDCYIIDGASGPTAFLDPGTLVSTILSTLGNVLQGPRSSATTIFTDSENYLGISDTSSVVTVNVTHPVIDYQITIADESGGAGTNNIIIQDSAGGFINGLEFIVINENFGSYTLHAIGAGNWIITAKSVPSAVTKKVSIQDDFLGAYAVSLTMFSDQSWMNVSVSAGSISFSPVAATDGAHPGVISSSAMDNSTNPDINLFMGLGSAGAVVPSLLIGGGQIVLQHVFQITALSTVTNRYIYRLGLGDTRAADQQNGIYIEYTDNVNGGNWVLKSADAGVRTATNSASVVDTDWHVLRIAVAPNGTLATFYMDNVLMGTINVNLPSGPVTPFVAALNTAGSLSAGTFLLDAVFFDADLPDR